MRCLILLALIALASAHGIRRPNRFNVPCGSRNFPKKFQMPDGAKKIDLKNPTDLPEGWTVVNDPSEFKLPNGLTHEDLKNGKVPAGWKKMDATKKVTKKVGGITRKTITPTVVDCDDVVVTKKVSSRVNKSVSKKASATATTNGKKYTWNKTWEPVITSNVYKINDIVVPDFFNTVRDFKSSCDWFTTGEVPDFFQAVGEAFEWTSVNGDARVIELGVNDFTTAQIREMAENAQNMAERVRALFR